MKVRWSPLGLRREVLILLPVSVLLLIGLSTFTLFAYRSAVELLTEERRGEAADLARELAERVAQGAAVDPETLDRWAPGAQAVVLAASDGTVRAASGVRSTSDPLRPLEGRRPERAWATGPGELAPVSVVGFAPLLLEGQRHYLRVDLPAQVLAGQRRGLSVLTVVVLGLDIALAALVLLFLRHLLSPYEALLARARQVGGEGGADVEQTDETAFLVSTFERAVEALAEHRQAPDDDIAALQRILAQSLESGLLLLGREGDVLGINPLGEGLLGLAAPEPGTPLEEALGERPRLLEVVADAVARRRGLRRAEVPAQVGGREVTLGLSVHPLRRDDGELRGFLVLFADLTEIQRQEEESRLAESLARLGELAAGVAHELRNSLATLSGYLALIERHPEDSVADYLEEIRRETSHLERVVTDFLAFARPETARIEEVDVVALLERAAADPVLGGERIEVHGGAGGATVAADPDLLERALRNLLHNAVEATADAEGAHRLVEVTVRSAREGLEILVEDRGPGLPEPVRERLFQPFVSGRSGGVGLGLALTHRIVTLHGGRVRIEDREGGGTRVVLELPAGRCVTNGNG